MDEFFLGKKEWKINYGNVDYLYPFPPNDYVCESCQGYHCKLWLPYETEHTPSWHSLKCSECLHNEQKNGEPIGQQYRRIAAIPTEDGKNFYHINNCPELGIKWWKNLPNASCLHMIDWTQNRTTIISNYLRETFIEIQTLLLLKELNFIKGLRENPILNAHLQEKSSIYENLLK